MPTFKFKATDKEGKIIAETLVAANEKEAETLLRDKKLKPLVLQEEKTKDKILSTDLISRFPLQEKINLCRYLAVMLNAGLPLADSFEILISGTANKTVRSVLQNISFSLIKGKSLSWSFAQYPQYFGEIFLAMLKAGETSATLSESLQHLANQYQQENDLRKKVLSALLYPIIIVLLMISLGILMLTFVLPRLGKVYLSLNLELPLLTRLLFNLSLFLEKNLLLVTIGFLFLAGAFFLFSKSKPGKNLLYWLVSHTPVLNKILLEYNLVRFTQSLSSLLAAGVSINESLEIAAKSLNIANQEKIAQGFGEKVSRGLPLSTTFSQAKIFPPLMTEMVAVGEKTGNLDKLLLDVSLFYKEEVENSLKNFVALLEPALMIVVGIAVGIMVLAFITPIYSLIGKLQPQ